MDRSNEKIFMRKDSCTQKKNPSFEGQAADATMPRAWWACSKGTTPDILPGFWGVYNTPEDGQTYVGLITREDGSYESIGQRLEHKLQAHQCYTMSLSLSHSSIYAGYSKAIYIEIYLSNTKCDLQERIWRSDVITREQWQNLSFEFTPTKAYQYFTIVAVARRPETNGNILLDNISRIVPCDRV